MDSVIPRQMRLYIMYASIAAHLSWREHGVWEALAPLPSRG